MPLVAVYGHTPPTPILRPRRLGTRARVLVSAIGLAALVMVVARAGAARTDLDPAESEEDAALAALIAAEEARAASWSLAAAVPVERIGYRRGHRRSIEVVALGPQAIEVEISTARAFLAMREAARADGVELQLESGFRTREEQAELYRAWRRGRGNRAARPGRSNHQSGRALDIAVNTVPGAREWLEENARRFGFKRTVKSEPWHWEYVEVPRARKASKGKKARKHRRGKAARKATRKARRKSRRARTAQRR
ncbi:MAG TPA: D-alanyl-D-alanine carboxypeptidase family protein [Kofleriaceae bacterium]|nr:D-alanyl-D-alanine carboxypeptidase family protein [Kofleriaceae bacterium]